VSRMAALIALVLAYVTVKVALIIWLVEIACRSIIYIIYYFAYYVHGQHSAHSTTVYRT
jgi:hypothetical protein